MPVSSTKSAALAHVVPTRTVASGSNKPHGRLTGDRLTLSPGITAARGRKIPAGVFSFEMSGGERGSGGAESTGRKFVYSLAGVGYGVPIGGPLRFGPWVGMTSLDTGVKRTSRSGVAFGLMFHASF